jgi:hypothetical protein
MDYFKDGCIGGFARCAHPSLLQHFSSHPARARFHNMSARWDKQAKMTMWPYRKGRQT